MIQIETYKLTCENLGVTWDTELQSVFEQGGEAGKIFAMIAEKASRVGSHAKLEWQGADKIEPTMNHPKIKDLVNKIESVQSELTYYSKEVTSKLVRMNQLGAELAELKRVPRLDLRKQVGELLASEHRILPSVVNHGDCLQLVTTDLEIHHYKPEFQIDYKIPIGSYKIELHFDGKIYVSRNGVSPFSYESFFHPHVNKHGEVCWGSEHLSPKEWAAHYQLAAPVKSILGILTNYNPESPYRTMSQFVSNMMGKDSVKEMLEGISNDQLESSGDSADFWAEDCLINIDDLLESEFLHSGDDDDSDRERFRVELFEYELMIDYNGAKVPYKIDDIVKTSNGPRLVDDIINDWERY